MAASSKRRPERGGRPRLPVGTVTFLRTDVEGSMDLARGLGAAWDAINVAHLDLIRQAVAGRGGSIVRTEGDAIFAVFPEAGEAVAAAVDAQRSLASQRWPTGAAVRVRMGLHSGEAHLAGDDYGGVDVGRAARVAAAGHGGQILVSSSTAALVADGLPPGVGLDDLGIFRLRGVTRPERLAQLTIGGLPSSFPPPRTDGGIGSLPERLTSFVGRGDEVEALVGMVRDTRLVTLTGPGGIGKSSLAIEVARRSETDFPDGAWFVPLADVIDPGDVTAGIAHGIGLFDGPERSAVSALPGYLRDRSVLLVIDNIDHLGDAADQIASVVRASPGSRVLVTSRSPLHVGGEHEYPVRPLGTHAVRLFTDRARAVQPGWEPGAERGTVREICALVDDLPLGIELAAARIGVLSPTVIRDRLAARLPLPGRGVRDAPARHRTLEGVVAWSHDQLEPRLQSLLRTVAVFDGGFDIEQVAPVIGPQEARASAPEDPRAGGSELLDDLLELVDRSLVMPVPDRADRVRFRLLRTVQSFALDRLAASGHGMTVRRRHAEAFANLVSEVTPDLTTSRHVDAVDRIEPEVANIRAAIRWSIDAQAADIALRLVADMWRFWQAFGLAADGRRLTEAALALPGAQNGSLRARATGAAGNLAYWQGDNVGARRWYEAQIALARAADDEACLADAMFNMSHVFFYEHTDEAAIRASIDDVVARFRALGDERGEARAGWAYGILAMNAGRPDEATRRLEQGLAAFERLDDPTYHAMSLATLGWAAFGTGDIAAAAHASIRALTTTHAMRDLGTTAVSLHVGVLLAVMLDRLEDGAVVLGAFDAACERFGVRPPAALDRFIRSRDPFVAVREGLAPDVFAAAYERGRRMDLDETVALVVRIGEAADAGGPAGGG